jgi:hypothetical protein
MASTYSTSLRLELIGQGEQSGTWGITTNNNFGALVEQAITGVQTISMSNASYTLSNFNGTVDEARNAVLVIAGTNLAPQNVVAPAVEKVYIINNQSGNTVTIKTSGGNGVGITNNTTVQVYCDGTNFFSATPNINSVTGNFAATGNVTAGNNVTATSYLVGNALSVTGSGSTGGSFTTNGILYTPGGINNAGTLATGTTTVTGNLSTTGTLSVTGTAYTGSIYNYGGQTTNGFSQINNSQTVTGNLTVSGTLSAGAITGVTGIIKSPIIVQTSYTAVTTSSSSPQPSGHFAQITPSSASSKILVLWYGVVSQPTYLISYLGENYMQVAMYRNNIANSGTVGINVTVLDQALRIGENGLSLAYVDSPNTTATVTYQMYYWKDGAAAASTTYNPFGGATITLLEITQ